MATLSMDSAFAGFAGKRVFVTGHTGFKGAWLAFLLHRLGAKVMGYALPPPPGPNLFGLLNLAGKITHTEGDVRDASRLSDAIDSFEPEYVLHLAAQALVGRSYYDPADTFSTNVMGSVHLLDAVRRCKSIRSLVYITSDKCYENVEWVWGYRETDRLGGRDPYSASKACAEIVFSSYARSFFASRPELGVASTRAGNVIGGGDWAADRIVPDCVRAIEANVPIVLRNPGATRPWQHVLEPLSGYLLLAHNLYEGTAENLTSWNFGPASFEEVTVHQIAQAIVGCLGRGTIELAGVSNRHHEAQLLKLNCDKAHALLGWYPRWSTQQTIFATARWYGEVLDGANPESITLAQLREYFPELT